MTQDTRCYLKKGGQRFVFMMPLIAALPTTVIVFSAVRELRNPAKIKASRLSNMRMGLGVGAISSVALVVVYLLSDWFELLIGPTPNRFLALLALVGTICNALGVFLSLPALLFDRVDVTAWLCLLLNQMLWLWFGILVMTASF